MYVHSNEFFTFTVNGVVAHVNYVQRIPALTSFFSEKKNCIEVCFEVVEAAIERVRAYFVFLNI